MHAKTANRTSPPSRRDGGVDALADRHEAAGGPTDPLRRGLRKVLGRSAPSPVLYPGAPGWRRRSAGRRLCDAAASRTRTSGRCWPCGRARPGAAPWHDQEALTSRFRRRLGLQGVEVGQVLMRSAVSWGNSVTAGSRSGSVLRATEFIALLISQRVGALGIRIHTRIHRQSLPPPSAGRC